MGHIAKNCRSRPIRRNNEPQNEIKTQANSNQGNGNNLSVESRPGRYAAQYKSAQ